MAPGVAGLEHEIGQTERPAAGGHEADIEQRRPSNQIQGAVHVPEALAARPPGELQSALQQALNTAADRTAPAQQKGGRASEGRAEAIATRPTKVPCLLEDHAIAEMQNPGFYLKPLGPPDSPDAAASTPEVEAVGAAVSAQHGC